MNHLKTLIAALEVLKPEFKYKTKNPLNDSTLYDRLEDFNHHSICALIDALNSPKLDLTHEALADVCCLLIEADYLDSIVLDESIRQRLLRIRSSLSLAILEPTVRRIEKGLKRVK